MSTDSSSIHWTTLMTSIAVVLSLAPAVHAADPDAPAFITISETVVATEIEPIGANLTTVTGGTNLATNNLIRGSGFEPAVIRFLIRIERSGPDWIEWDESEGGVHMWDLNATGFGNGARVRLYRIVDSSGEPLPFTEGLHDVTGADHVEFLASTTVPTPSAEHPLGGWIAEGSEGTTNRVYLDDAIETEFGDYAMITVTKLALPMSEVHPRLWQWFVDRDNHFWMPDEWHAELVPHPGSLPQEFTEPGASCLRIDTDASIDWVGQYIFHAHDDEEGQYYSQLEPGASYRAEVWMRQSGLGADAVRFVSSGAYASVNQSDPWSPTSEWQRFTYDFVGPDYPDVADDPWHQPLGLEITGPGTLWIDNFVVYRNDAAHDHRPFSPHHVALDEIMASFPESGPKPALRFYPTIYPGHQDLDHLFGDHPTSALDFIYNIGPASQAITLPQSLEWSLATGSTPDDRVVPFITLPEEYTEVEWKAVVEYLGDPYDPASDDPVSKPYAYRRFLRRGHGAPWTEDFREIVLELGNETWHNGAGGYGWHGFGRPGWVFTGGLEYGLFADYFFRQNVAAMPAWTDHNLGSKIRFALGAGYDGAPEAYGEAAAQRAPEITSYLGHANYVGPTWETGDVPHEIFDDHGMQETLVGFSTGMQPLVDQVAETRDDLASAGLADYEVIAYEGGPSGYYVPGQGTPQQEAVSELYGKSLGMAVSALDSWLYSSQAGYRHQCYLGFASGQFWSSHTMPRAGGFRRHTGWLALMMRNRLAPGDEMLQTTVVSGPTYERSGEDIPLISAYSISSGDTTSVFVLSRKLDGVHDGVDFGDGTTPVTVELPFDSCTGLTRYTLAAPDGSPADPRANNIDADQIVIHSQMLDPSLCSSTFTIDETTGGSTGGMPPGTVFLYVFEHDAGMIFADGFDSGDFSAWSDGAGG